MHKYKIVVYAISKNEEKHVKRWVESMKEADEIIVLDTGSTDKTVKLLKDLGVTVKSKKIKPFRFDIARNLSLDLVPKDTDICVCTDLDEVFLKGWRSSLEEVWQENTTRLAYNYNWSLDKNNKPIINFYIEKIHSRNDYTWTHPVHEVLSYIGDKEEIKLTTDLITLNHYPDKTKSRSSYLPLLELSIKEDPTDDRNMHYLGREYMYHGYFNKAIDTLIKHLSLKSATWHDERAASMRFIARCYTNLERYREAKMWYKEAIKELETLAHNTAWAARRLNLDEVTDFCVFCEEMMAQANRFDGPASDEFTDWMLLMSDQFEKYCRSYENDDSVLAVFNPLIVNVPNIISK